MVILLLLQPDAQDMSHFYRQYNSIQPYLQQKKEPQGDRENIQSEKERKKLVISGMYFNLPTRMAYMSAFYVHAVPLLVPVTGGMEMYIWAQRYYYRPTDGFLIQE